MCMTNAFVCGLANVSSMRMQCLPTHKQGHDKCICMCTGKCFIYADQMHADAHTNAFVMTKFYIPLLFSLVAISHCARRIRKVCVSPAGRVRKALVVMSPRLFTAMLAKKSADLSSAGPPIRFLAFGAMAAPGSTRLFLRGGMVLAVFYLPCVWCLRVRRCC
jgi:hypothetical protein